MFDACSTVTRLEWNSKVHTSLDHHHHLRNFARPGVIWVRWDFESNWLRVKGESVFVRRSARHFEALCIVRSRLGSKGPPMELLLK